MNMFRNWYCKKFIHPRIGKENNMVIMIIANHISSLLKKVEPRFQIKFLIKTYLAVDLSWLFMEIIYFA